ncbi:profilin, required for normal timing of actin polymerization in response to thermal stress [Schaereria dolodes]|nr:profilin, required for normal timing of actin polymerization in response to thermal stress [Schaereria dolodes]
MSWQAYVDTSLVGTGQLDKAAIFNAEGTSVWAASSGFNVRSHFRQILFWAEIKIPYVAPAEIKEVVNAYKDTAQVKNVQSAGFHIAGDRYVVIKSDDRSLYGKKGKEGIIIVKTTQAILVTHYPESVQPGTAANTVEQLGDYLVSVGY